MELIAAWLYAEGRYRTDKGRALRSLPHRIPSPTRLPVSPLPQKVNPVNRAGRKPEPGDVESTR